MRERARPPPFGAALLPVLPAHLVMGVDLARRDLLRGYVAAVGGILVACQGAGPGGSLVCVSFALVSVNSALTCGVLQMTGWWRQALPEGGHGGRASADVAA